MQTFRIIIPVTDIKAGAAFYRALLGREPAEMSPGRRYFNGGNGMILAVYSPADDGDDGALSPRRHENAYLYFTVPDLDVAYARAVAAGAVNITPPALKPWGERLFYFDDPFGNGLCVVEASTALPVPE